MRMQTDTLGAVRSNDAGPPGTGCKVGTEGPVRGLGALEAAVMAVLWDSEAPLPVRGVMDALTWDKPLAYTTVMTVLDNLHRKEYVERTMHGRAYQYRPTLSRGEAAADAIRQVLDEAVDPQAVLLHFASTVTDDESKVLRSGLNRRKRR
jgi:predicted transcriptional regulator